MAEAKPIVRVIYKCELVLTESEMRALEALAGYGTDPFLEVFYKHLGRSYLQDYEGGLRSLFDKIRADGRRQLATIDKARKALEELE